MIKRLLTFLLFVLCACAAFSQPAPASTSTPNPQQLIRQAHTVYIHSNTAYLIVDTMDRALMQQKQWQDLGLVLVGKPEQADLTLELDRQIFTHLHTFVLSDKRSTAVLGAGREWGLNGTLAAGRIASDVVSVLVAARLPGCCQTAPAPVQSSIPPEKKELPDSGKPPATSAPAHTV